MIEPIHIISLGAGVQSSTMALMAAHGEITPMPKCAIFADTQAEPKSVYTWLDWLEKQLPFPVHRVTKGKLIESALKLRTSKDGNTYSETCLPVYTSNPEGKKGMSQRQCTQTFKIVPIRQEMRKFGCDIIQWIGISLDEVHRMKPSRDEWCKNRWPLVDLRISRNDCVLWMEKHGYPKPTRSACIYCPYRSDNHWRELRNTNPDEFATAVRYEKQLQEIHTKLTHGNGTIPFLHNSRVPLDQVDFSTDEDHGQQVMFGNECEGMCGV